jgi:hypothetical protein
MEDVNLADMRAFFERLKNEPMKPTIYEIPPGPVGDEVVRLAGFNPEDAPWNKQRLTDV